jgi:hypothetical protein
MPDQKRELLEILDGLPPSKVVQILEFARHLQSPEHPSIPPKAAVRSVFGKYKNALNSSSDFSRRKAEERTFEDR